MFRLVSVRQCWSSSRWAPAWRLHTDLYKFRSLGKTFLRISRIRNIPLTWILARVFVYVPPFISQILHFICWKFLIFILVYFEWRDTKNQQYKYGDLLGLFYTCWWWMNNRVDESWLWAESQVWTKNWNVCIKEDRRAREEKNCMPGIVWHRLLRKVGFPPRHTMQGSGGQGQRRSSLDALGRILGGITLFFGEQKGGISSNWEPKRGDH